MLFPFFLCTIFLINLIFYDIYEVTCITAIWIHSQVSHKISFLQTHPCPPESWGLGYWELETVHPDTECVLIIWTSSDCKQWNYVSRIKVLLVVHTQFPKNVNILYNQGIAIKQNMLKHSRMHQPAERMTLKFFETQIGMWSVMEMLLYGFSAFHPCLHNSTTLPPFFPPKTLFIKPFLIFFQQ